VLGVGGQAVECLWALYPGQGRVCPGEEPWEDTGRGQLGKLGGGGGTQGVWHSLSGIVELPVGWAGRGCPCVSRGYRSRGYRSRVYSHMWVNIYGHAGQEAKPQQRGVRTH